nr:hypothetical protein BaRGS_011954 [Batillaria attramentaria]
MSCAFTLQHRLQFDNAHLRNVQWQFSKRLQYGSLVCLSQDDFETIYFATVTERKVKDLSRGIIQVTFERDLTQILNMTSNDEFVMAETTAFFESYRHVLERLTCMLSVPMMRYIVQCRKDVKPPKYLYTESESKKMNLRSLLKQQARFRHTEVQVLLPRDWPRLEELALNESQLEAVRTALTKELAIIQGPPGTGKTYVGLKVAQVLLENNDVWSYPHRYYPYSSLPSYRRKPILVVCYTNHALDQFLEGILGFCPEGIIRVGSRSKNESLEPFNLKQIRAQWRKEKKLSDCLRRSIGMTLGALRNSGEKLAMSTARYAGSMGNAIIEERALKDSMLAAHYDSLVKVRHHDSGWGLTLVTGQTRSVMADWLLFGNVVLNQDEEFDPYSMLAQKVSTCILSGTDICSESDVDTSADVTSLPFAVRAQLYRTWLKKLGLDTGGNRTKTGDNEDLDASKGAPMDDFLPDDVLKPVVDHRLYGAITSSVLQQLEEEKRFCIRAWLGIHEESREMSMEVLSNTWDYCLEKDFTTDTILTVSRIHRIHLYRYWVTGVARKLKFDESKGRRKHAHEKLLKRSQREILSDDILEPVVNKDLFSAIKRGMLQKLERQTAFCIRTWLGLHEFSQDPHALERVLEELSAAETDNPDDGEENDDVDADITYIDDVFEPDERVLDDDYDDDDDEDFFPRGLYSNRLDASASLTSPKWPTSVPEDGWTIPKSTRNKRLGQLKHLLQKLTPMDEVEARKVTDVWDAKLTLEDRVRLYLFWMKRYRPRLAHTLQDKAVEFRSCSMIYHELKAFGDLEILRQAKVIGMTTTGAARYQKVLARIGCPIIIVEEAAEVLEAHVVTTLHESCQHLILIGDHQQLRPSPTVYELCRHYQLDLSLFERLVNNKLPHSTLAVQHRMRPEVARLVRHIYPHLEDHVTTLDRPHIRGMKEDVFLFHHEALETTHDETISKSNVHEAALCVGLCRYLLQQGYPPQSITILAAYIGQVLEIKKLTQRSSLDGLKDVLVTAVDNYQGEENDVIILSLVRSNEEGSVGFLGTDNRVCVALSRARNGLYAFGNFRILGEKSELWRSVVKTATEHGQMGEGLTLRCENHPDTELLVTTADDFAGAPEGGCKLNCDARLECGHVCTLFCHGYDQDHVMYRCMKACERQVCDAELHSCPRRCYEDCERCMVRVEKTVPKCGHTEMVPCSTDPGRWACRILVERQWPCGHLVSAACHHTPDTFPCPEPCGAPLDCGHGCPGTCGRCFYSRVHAPCQVPCGKALEGCGHLCPLPCSTTCLPCRKVCRFSCSHSACTQSCGEPCQPCVDEPCPWECPHRPCRSKCSKPCEPCPMTCRRKLECGHRCSGCCGEECVCYSCEESKFVPLTTTGQLTKDHQGLTSHETTQLIKLPGCGHIFLAITLDVYVVRKLKSLTAARPLTCPACPKVIEDSACWRYHEKLHSRHREQQDAKRRLRDAITVSGQDKIQRSVCKLSESKGFDLEAINGYTRSLLDVNTAVTITNQIKFVRVIELILQTLRKTFSERIDFDNDLTQLVTTITSLRRDIMADKMMTDQRRREFAAELRRLTFIALLQVAKEMSSAPNPPSPIQEQADSLLEILTGRHQQDDVASRIPWSPTKI